MAVALSEIDLLKSVVSLAGVDWAFLDSAHHSILDRSDSCGVLPGLNHAKSGKALLSLVHAEDRDYVAAEIAQAIALYRSYAFEYRLQGDDNRWISQKGRLVGSCWLVVLSDITSLRTAQDNALSRASHWRTLVHMSRPDSQWFDLTNTQRHQVYSGVTSETSESAAVVADSEGLVVAGVDGGIFEAMYASTDQVVATAHCDFASMSQTGAALKADHGWNFAEILSFYYPGTALANLF